MSARILERERLPLAIQAVLTLALLAFTRTLGLPPEIRAIGALIAVLLIPGAALVLLWPGSPLRGWLPVTALSLPMSLLAVSGAALVGWKLAWGPLPLAAGYLFGTFLVTLAALVRAHQVDEARQGTAWKPFRRRFSVSAAVLLLGAAVMMARTGAPAGPDTDGPDHMAAINEIMTSQEMFPHQGLMPAGEENRLDPRKGVFHVGMAMAAELADVPAIVVWRAAPAVLVVPWLAVILLLGLEFGLSRAGAWVAAGLALLFTGGSGGAWAARLGYGGHVGILVAWGATWVFLELLRDFSWWRAALLGVLVAVGVAVHPMAPAFFFLPAVLLLVVGKGRFPFRASTLAKSLAVSLAVAAPVVALRVLEARGAVNPLHEQTMPILELGRQGSILWPPAIYRILGPTGILGLVLLPVAGRTLRDRLGVRYLIALSVASVAPAIVPGVFDLGARFTSSLPIKLLYIAPYVWVLGAILGARWRGNGAWLRGGLTVLIVLGLPGMVRRFDPETVSGRRPKGIEAVLDSLRSMPGRRVVAADPWVSSLVAAQTPDWPITVLGQHGNPLDTRGLERLNDLGEILSPWISPAKAVPVLAKYRADYVLVPRGGGEPWRSDFAAARGGVLSGLRKRKFASLPASFPVVRRTADWVLFGVRRSRTSPEPPPPVIAAEGNPSGRQISRIDGSAGGVRLVSLDIPDRLEAGGGGTFVFWWLREKEAVGWPVEAHLRFVRTGRQHRWKLPRLLRERIGKSGSGRARDRVVVVPFLGAWPVTAWPRNRAVADTARIAIPEDLKPGRYEVSARVLRHPMFPRVSLRDVLWENDRWQGGVVDTVEISARKTRKPEGSA